MRDPERFACVAVALLLVQLIPGTAGWPQRRLEEAPLANTREPEATWRLPGKGFDQAIIPLDVALDDEGHAYVADGKNNAIIVYDTDGRLVDKWANPPAWSEGVETRCDGFFVPQALAAGDTSQLFYVLWTFYQFRHADMHDHRR